MRSPVPSGGRTPPAFSSDDEDDDGDIRATTKRALERYSSALAFREALVDAIGKLPTHEEFAEHLAKLFPPEAEARAARRATIEKGIAEALAKAGMPAPQIAELIANGAGLVEPVKSKVPEFSTAESPKPAPVVKPGEFV